MQPTYDTLGKGYTTRRRPDPRIASAIVEALGDAASVLNVGAGAGSYEPPDRNTFALEPSAVMIAQRPALAAPVVRGRAEELPFATGAVDAAMAILTLHHWDDWRAGVRELKRVARERVVVLTWDPAAPAFWLAEYLSGILDFDRAIFPLIDDLCTELGRARVFPVEVPHDCSDGFLGAYWRRPEAYLDPRVRASISTFARIGDSSAELARLASELESGAWEEKYGALRRRSSLDTGYRLVVGLLVGCVRS